MARVFVRRPSGSFVEARRSSALARMFSADPTTVRHTAFANIAQSSRRLIAKEPVQSCSCCYRRRHNLCQQPDEGLSRFKPSDTVIG